MPKVVIQARQSVSTTARRFGFKAADIWELPENSKLKSRVVKLTFRADGEILYLPNIEPAQANSRTGEVLRVTLEKEETVCCPYCENPLTECGLAYDQQRGQHIGSGQTLARNMWGDNLAQHPWYTGSGSLQAHHVTCSETMNNEDWKQYCREFGYDINRELNGVMLPNPMSLACHLGVPLHRGGHSNTNPNYPEYVSSELTNVVTEIESGKYCGPDGCERLRDRLDKLSTKLCTKIGTFKLRLTYDGADYDPTSDRGCGNLSSVTDKEVRTDIIDCISGRVHETYQHDNEPIEGMQDRNKTVIALQTNDRHIQGRS